MIPSQLTIKGIYSYQLENIIDFNQLTEASIFGIFGQVGSGKSTLLEAISFALYSETERLNQRDNRYYNRMNLKSDELLIDFIFNRFCVNGKRNKKNFEKINKFDRKAYQEIDNEWRPIEPDKVADIIGLSYTNFRRNIIIPQGQFKEFLQLGAKERTQMLKELFALEKYELYEKNNHIGKREQ